VRENGNTNVASILTSFQPAITRRSVPSDSSPPPCDQPRSQDDNGYKVALVPAAFSSRSPSAGVLGKRRTGASPARRSGPSADAAPQIIGPHDAGIAAAILDNLAPQSWDARGAPASPLCADRTREMQDAYFAALAARCLHRCARTPQPRTAGDRPRAGTRTRARP
jgi:hypothetical protein